MPMTGMLSGVGVKGRKVTNRPRSPHNKNVGVVDEADYANNEEHKEVSHNFGRPYRKSSRHL